MQKVYFKFSKAPKFSLNDFIASNKEALEQFAKKRAEHIKKNLGFSRFFEYGAQLETIEKGRVLFQIFIKSIDKTTEEGIISEYLRKFTVNNMAMEGGTITYNDAAAIDNAKKGDNLVLKGNLQDMKLYLQLKKAFNMLNATRLQNKEQIRKLHKVIYAGVYSFAGEFKKMKNWFGGMEQAVTSSPKNVPSELNKAIKRFHSMNGKINEFERIINFHIDYERVHPFQDGNSRLGRLILNHQFMKAGYPPLLYEHKRSSAYRNALAKAVNNPKKNTAILKYFYENYNRSLNKFWMPLIEKHIGERLNSAA